MIKAQFEKAKEKVKPLIAKVKERIKPTPDPFESQKARVQELTEEFKEANKFLALAEHRFNQASPRDVDICSYELKAAETRVGLILKEIKEIQQQMN